MSKESLSAAYPPMLAVALGLVLFSLEWVVARPWLIALLGLGGVGMVYLVVRLRRLYHDADETAQTEERHKLIDRWNKRRDHRRE